ncbi:MAG: dockerin type I domain-containing protein [Candidatus Fimenecus sp.]
MTKNTPFRKRMFCTVFCALLVLTCVCVFQASAEEDIWDGSTAAVYAGGTGTAENPYQIENGAQLKKFSDEVNGGQTAVCAVLTKDIVLNDGIIAEGAQNTNVWTPIGNYSNMYSGIFDGQGHTISGLYKSELDFSQMYVGLFGYIGTAGMVKNVGITNSYLNGMTVGTFAGHNLGTIENCYTTNSKVTAIGFCGGIIGGNGENGTVKNCYSTAAVLVDTETGYDTSNFGGICGHNANLNETAIENCYYDATQCEGTFAAGIGADSNAFASGEVAYLLQQAAGDTQAQIWGQKATVAGSSPVLTAEEIYKVRPVLNTAGETVSYTVHGFGDVNNDGFVTEADYPLLIENMWEKPSDKTAVLSSDINRDGVIDAFDAANLNLMLTGAYALQIDENGALQA